MSSIFVWGQLYKIDPTWIRAVLNWLATIFILHQLTKVCNLFLLHFSFQKKGEYLSRPKRFNKNFLLGKNVYRTVFNTNVLVSIVAKSVVQPFNAS